MFQSPRSGKFVSDTFEKLFLDVVLGFLFQSPISGKFVSDEENKMTLEEKIELFQSPRSGEFVSNKPWEQSYGWALKELAYFNPLDQGNLYQIMEMLGSNENSTQPFQSPRSGKFVSDCFFSQHPLVRIKYVSIP